MICYQCRCLVTIWNTWRGDELIAISVSRETFPIRVSVFCQEDKTRTVRTYWFLIHAKITEKEGWYHLENVHKSINHF